MKTQDLGAMDLDAKWTPDGELPCFGLQADSTHAQLFRL